jgi:hypothetical protein
MARLIRTLAVLALIAALVPSCSRNKVIPKGKMAEIYADMLVADQWISQHGKGRQADTSLVYEPIFRKYGYTTEDFRRSAAYYVAKPKEYQVIYKEAGDMLEAHLKELTAEEKKRHRADSIASAVASMNVPMPEISYGKDFGRIGGVRVEKEDGLYKIVAVEPDYGYVGLELKEESDTAAVPQSDTLAVELPDVEEKAPSEVSREELRKNLNSLDAKKLNRELEDIGKKGEPVKLDKIK